MNGEEDDLDFGSGLFGQIAANIKPSSGGGKEGNDLKEHDKLEKTG